MKVLKFINDNAILASAIASVITIAINTIIQIVFKKSDRKYEEKMEKKKQQREEILNKAEFHIENKKWGMTERPDISLFMTDYKVSLGDDNELEFHYNENVLNKSKYEHLQIYIKNIGNADINQMDICVTLKEKVMLCDFESIEFFVNHKAISQGYTYDRKILKNDIILIDIAYLEDTDIFTMAVSELALLFKDSFGNIYEQPFFISSKKLYEPRLITKEEYKSYHLPDDIFEKIKNALLKKKYIK